VLPSACAVGLREGRLEFLAPVLSLRKTLMGKNCSVRRCCSERLPGPWAGSPLSDPSVLGLRGTHVGQQAREEMCDTVFPPTRIQISEESGWLHLFPSFCGVLLPQGEWEKGEGALSEVMFALHSPAQEGRSPCVCPSAQSSGENPFLGGARGSLWAHRA